MFDPTIAKQICDRIASGETLLSMCGKDGLPSFSAVMAWVRDLPTFKADYEQARAQSAEALADMAQEAVSVEPDPQRARLKSETYLKLAGKFRPDKFGDRIDISMTGQLDLVAAIGEAQTRTLRLGCDQEHVVDVEYVEIKGQKAIGAADSESVSTPDDVDIFS